jgi:cell division protease FtsH
VTQDELKTLVGQAALHYVVPGEVVGVGTGSTVNKFIDALATMKERIPGAVSSSKASTERLRSLGIAVFDANEVADISVYIDGADEIDAAGCMIKGGGAALTREKIGHYLSLRADKVLPDLDLRHLVEVTEGRSPADLETIVNQAGITAVQGGDMIGAETLMHAAERVMVGNVNTSATKERDRDRRIIAIHEWGHFLVDFELERRRAEGDWNAILADMKTIKISLKANPRNNALGFVFHKQGANLLKTKGDIEHDVRVLLGGMANEELFFGEEGTTNGAHNDITRVTKLLHHAVAEMGMYRKTRLNFGALSNDGHGGSRHLDEETRGIMEAQSERLYSETKTLLARLKPLTEHLAGKLMDKGEMSLTEALFEIRSFEAACYEFSNRAGLASAS